MKFHDRRLLASCALSGVGTLCVYEQTLKGSEKCADRDHGRMEALSSAVARTEKAVLLVFNEVVIKVEKGGGLWEQLEGVVIRSMQPDPAPPVATDTIQELRHLDSRASSTQESELKNVSQKPPCSWLTGRSEPSPLPPKKDASDQNSS